MYHCFNVVTGASGYPAAVLIRALEPVEGIDTSASGPGRLCRALGIDRRLNGWDVTQGALYLARGPRPEPPIVAGPRIGVPYAGAWALKPRRFFVAQSPWVSARRRPRPPGGATPGRPGV
jgi:DNA-3-methyladenine glycosylase